MINFIKKIGDIPFVVMLVLYYSTSHINNTIVNVFSMLAVTLMTINRLWGMLSKRAK